MLVAVPSSWEQKHQTYPREKRSVIMTRPHLYPSIIPRMSGEVLKSTSAISATDSLLMGWKNSISDEIIVKPVVLSHLNSGCPDHYNSLSLSRFRPDELLPSDLYFSVFNYKQYGPRGRPYSSVVILYTISSNFEQLRIQPFKCLIVQTFPVPLALGLPHYRPSWSIQI